MCSCHDTFPMCPYVSAYTNTYTHVFVHRDMCAEKHTAILVCFLTQKYTYTQRNLLTDACTDIVTCIYRSRHIQTSVQIYIMYVPIYIYR